MGADAMEVLVWALSTALDMVAASVYTIDRPRTPEIVVVVLPGMPRSTYLGTSGSFVQNVLCGRHVALYDTAFRLAVVP